MIIIHLWYSGKIIGNIFGKDIMRCHCYYHLRETVLVTAAAGGTGLAAYLY
jgi:NADPH:quinone reductase-like Zn-dependent oxidoreductase